jgi:tetratricopeptide (TPR) repeat protein
MVLIEDKPTRLRRPPWTVALVDWWRRPVLRRGVSRAWAVVGVVATLTGLWGSYGHILSKPPPPPVMRGTLNLAVADFASVDSRGGQAAKATAKLATDVATSMAALLAEQLRPLAGRLRLEVRGPTEFPYVRGASQAARARTAKQRADQIDADIVVYGTLSTDGTKTVLQPELYISDSIQGDTGEVVGDHPWGAPLQLSGDPDSNPLAAQLFGEPLSIRTKALASMILGIWYYHAGQPSIALQHLRAAAENPEWPDQEGKELVYLFLGNAAERQGSQQQTQQGQRHPLAGRRSFAEAVNYYQKALRMDGQYARAWYGIAETRFLQVGLSCQPDRIDRQLLAQAIRDFQRGQLATHRPTLANLDAKIAFGLGRAYVCMTLAGIANRRVEAEGQLAIAIRAYQPILPEDSSTRRLRQLAAEAYGQRGLLATAYADAPDIRAQDLHAVADYQQAIALSADRPQRQGVFYDNLADIYDRLRMPREAQDARNKARNLGRLATQPEPTTTAGASP